MSRLRQDEEILKQLSRIFKRDADKLDHFIDRFRPRLVEMATMDIDAGVRVVAITVIKNAQSPPACWTQWRLTRLAS